MRSVGSIGKSSGGRGLVIGHLRLDNWDNSVNSLSRLLRLLENVGALNFAANLFVTLVWSSCCIDLEATYSLNDHTGDLVRVAVGGGTTVLKVALAFLGNSAVDTH